MTISYEFNKPEIYSFVESGYLTKSKEEGVAFLQHRNKYLNIKEELLEEVLGYWIEYNYSFSYGKRKENNETYEWLDE
tara:strand:+ start:399 stop:632 length:234 start_codon:yes stop_codon:yes gene_type:complete